MAFMTWTDELSVEIGEIDEQHKKLVNMINDLSYAMSKGKGKDVIEAILSGLTDYTVEHFANEENYFKRFGYTGFLKHKREHNDFVDKITQFQNDYKIEKVMLSLEIMKFLKEWLQDHIKGSDKEYIRCFKENGLS